MLVLLLLLMFLLLLLLLLLPAVPIIFGPAFADMSTEAGAMWLGAAMAVVYSFVLVGLDNIQDSLENPFDGMSQDDIRFDKPSALLTRTIIRGENLLSTLPVPVPVDT